MKKVDLFSKMSISRKTEKITLSGLKKTKTSKEASVFDGKTRRVFFRNHSWLFPLCVGLIYFLSGGFVTNRTLRLVLSPILAFPLFLSLVQLLYQKRNTYIRSQCKVLFQSLCTSVSGGYSLESAFLAARPSVERVFGPKCIVAQSLREMEKERAAQLPFSESLLHLCTHMDYTEIYPVIQALAITKTVGSGIISILRSSCQMISELISVNQEVDANNAGKNAEAILLCLMPYGITFTLSAFTGVYMETAKNTTLGTILMLVAFALSIMACGILLRLVGSSKKSVTTKSTRSIFIPLPTIITKKIQKALLSLLPESLITQEYEQAIELSITPDLYFREKIQKCISVLFLGCSLFLIVFLIFQISLFFLIPATALLVLFFQVNEKQRIYQRRESIMEDIPLFLAILTTLLQSGVLLSRAIHICSGAFPSTGILGREITYMKKQMSTGISAAAVIEDFSTRTPIPEAQAALLLASGFERKGGYESIELLDLQSKACWSLCKNASRKRKEREAVQMILPMMLDLICVLLVVMTPAILSLNGINP